MTTITGERVTTPSRGFNPTWQRHVAAYACAAELLGPGRVLDLGCGIGHSYELLAPRETVGLDRDAGALAGQARPTVVGDMRDLPFAEASFAGVVSVHSIEHVPDPRPVVAEVVRVLEPDGVAIFVTPNRFTFARAEEIIDPYHYVEYGPADLARLLEPSFGAVEIHGLFGSPAYLELVAEQLAKLDRVLGLDPLRLRRLVPRRVRQRLYDRLLTRERAAEDPREARITPADFRLGSARIAEEALDLIAVCRRPGGSAAGARAPLSSVARDGPPVDFEVMEMLRKVVPLLLVAGVAVAVNEGLRNRVLDLLFGAEEEFDYTPTTSGAGPPSHS